MEEQIIQNKMVEINPNISKTNKEIYKRQVVYY